MRPSLNDAGGRRTAWGLAAIPFLLLAGGGCPAKADEASPLIEVLRSRAGTVRTLQADVAITETFEGPDSPRYLQTLRDRITWYGKQNQPVPPGLASMAKAAEAPVPPRTFYFRYFFQSPGLLRLECFRQASFAEEARGPVSVFTGERWQSFSPATAEEKQQGIQHDLLIRGKEGGPEWHIDVALGMGVFTQDLGMELAKLGPRVEGSGQVPWDVYLGTLPLEAARAGRQPLPGSEVARPFLELNGRPFKDTQCPGRRMRLWFDDTRAYLPLRVESERVAVDKMTGNPFLLPTSIIEWSDPRTLPDGFTVATTATVRWFGTAVPPVEGAPPEKWTQRSFETGKNVFRFSNVRVNEPLDPALFKVDPPVGTHVVDEVAHETYITGSAGRQLRKMALQTREELPPPEQAMGGRAAWWFAAGAVAAILAVGAVLYHRRKAALRRRAA